MDLIEKAADMAYIKFCFNVLGIKKLNNKTLKKAYREQSKIYHPDNNETGDKEKFVVIKNAYERLKKLLVKTFVIKFSVESILTGKCIYECGNRIFMIDIKNFRNFLKPYKFTYLGQTYRVIFKFVPQNGFRLYTKNKKHYIEKTLNISIDDLVTGFKCLTYNNKKYTFKIPRKGMLEDTIKITDDIFFKVCYNIVV